MALSTKKGTFALNTSTGNQSVTSMGFQPVALVLWVVGATANDTAAAHSSMSMGFGVSSSDRGCVSWRDDDAEANIETAKGSSVTKILRTFSDAATPTVEFEADLVTLDADGFTIDITDAPPSAYIVHYFAVGGADITNQDFFSFNTTNTATQDVTLAFEPDLLLFLTNGATTGDSGHAQLCIGASSGAGENRASYWISDDAVGAAICKINNYASACLLGASTGTGTTERFRARVTATSGSGFTLTNDVQSAAGEIVLGLALKGGQYKVLGDAAKATTGTQSTTGAGFNPTGALWFGTGTITPDTLGRDNPTIMVGGASAAGTEGFSTVGSDDGAATSNTFSYSNSAKAFGQLSGVSQSVNMAADLVSFDGDGYTLDYTTAGTAHIFNAVTFGDAAAVAGSKPKSLGLIGCG
jgi:hypothetical protein